MAKQKNKYLVSFADGGEKVLTASRLSEAQNTASKMGGASSVQRIFKNATRVCHNVKGKVHYI